MAAILEEYPQVHCTINLTSSLLIQLQKYYVDRLGPFVDVKRNLVDVQGFFALWKGKTDPWIDLALTPTSQFTDRDLQYLLHNPWNAFYITDVMIGRFPEFKELKEKHLRKELLSEQDLREIKFWFFLAYFDPDFLEKKVSLADGNIIEMAGLISRQADGTYRLKKKISEQDCNRMVAETYKVLANIIPVHRKLLYHSKSCNGQIEITTTPYYHPILPLIYGSDLAKISQPNSPMPARFSYPADADAQVAMAVDFYRKTFGVAPHGMWLAEGSVAHEVIHLLTKNGLLWTATDEKVLHRSLPVGLSALYPYQARSRGTDSSLGVVFRDTELSDKIGFVYQHYRGEDAANDFIDNVVSQRPLSPDEPDRLLTVILDGENAWEWYRYDNDGKEFLRALYRKLAELDEAGQVLTVTMSEYISGNARRNITPHPVSSMVEVEQLYPASWINANFDTWIGSPEKNRAWEYLRIAREDLERSGIKPPNLEKKHPAQDSNEWYSFKAWDEMYAAEGSDWFWWYGTRQYVPGGTAPFDKAFITHLKNIYLYARRAGGTMPEREFGSIISLFSQNDRIAQGTMIPNKTDTVKSS